MINFFRKTRKKMAESNKPIKYLRYAIGEILLVVIGILVALQINNANEIHKIRNKELVYLNNIKTDLQLNKISLDEFIKAREASNRSVEIVLEIFEGMREIDLNEFNLNTVNVMIWYPFHQNDNTYRELMNSGNFAIISNKLIKNKLQDNESNYKRIAFIENEMQQDYETYLYEPFFSIADLQSSMKNYTYQLENGKGLTNNEIDLSDVKTLLKNQKFKNGFSLSFYNSSMLLDEYSEMIERTNQLIQLIDIETEN